MESGRKAISLKKEIGSDIELDPATNENSLIPAKTKFILPIDGLKEDWNYKSIWLNPPYGIDKNRGTNLKKWIEKVRNCCGKYINK